MLKYFTRFSTYTLLVALAISAVAEFYSIVGLATIFSGAVIPIVIMGVVLGLGKLTATVWLKLNWERASITYKLYLIPAIAILMFLTSMGIFGYLSKAHSEQSQISGDALSKVAIYDEKIKTARENIEADRKQLKQMDEAVDQVMARSTTEEGASKSNTIRRAQARDRTALAKNIEANQKLIATLNDESAPLRAEVRKVEAEVGPIKYIAAIIYGDNADANLLEAAVRWVIIIIVAVFDPLALILLLAAQQSMRWEREEDKQKTDSQQDISDHDEFFTKARLVARGLDAEEDIRLTEEANAKIAEIQREAQYEPDDGPLTKHQLDQIKATVEEDHSIDCYKCGTKLVDAPGIGLFCPNKECDVLDNTRGAEIEFTYVSPAPLAPKPKRAKRVKSSIVEQPVQEVEQPVEEPLTTDAVNITTDGITQRSQMFHPAEGYVSFDGKNMSIDALRGMRPDLILNANAPEFEILYGSKFPDYARMGDIYTRVDAMPHRVYKFNGDKWINMDKNQNTVYLHNVSYIQFLISKLESGEYDPELLTADEQDEIAAHLEKINNIK